MDSQIYCPTCAKALSRNQVSMTQVTTLKCRNCKEVVSQSDGMASYLPASIDPDDVAAIDTWVESSKPPFEKQVLSRSKLSWIRYSNGVKQELTYDAESHSVVCVSVLTTELGEIAIRYHRKLQEMFARHLIQPVATRTSEEAEGRAASRAIWGCARYLSTSTLHPDLLEGILKQLAEFVSIPVSD